MWASFDEPKTFEDLDTSVCQFCRGSIKVDEVGQQICCCCGVTVQTIDLSPEWRFYGDDGKPNPSRAGPPMTEHEDLGIRILNDRKGSSDMRRISRAVMWSAMTYRDQTYHTICQYISMMAGNAGYSKMIIQQAFHYYKQITREGEKTFRGHNRDGIIAASIYIACRVENCPRTDKDIAQTFNLDKASATKGCKNAMDIINQIEAGKAKLKYVNATPHTFILRFSSCLGLDDDMTKIAEFIALQIDKHNLIPENTPRSIASGILYFLAKEFKLELSADIKKQISTISDVCEVTINKCYKKLLKLKERLLPPEIYAKYA